jgi:hypothetical protein
MIVTTEEILVRRPVSVGISNGVDFVLGHLRPPTVLEL